MKIKMNMNKDKQNLLQILAVPLGFGAGGIIVGLIWPSFYWLLIGCIIILFALFYLIYGFIAKDMDDMSPVPGCYGLVILVLITVLNYIFNGTRYLSSNDNRQHRYPNCETIVMSNHIIEVSRLEGFFHLCFSNCKICEQREELEEKQRRTNRKIESLQKRVDWLQDDIDEAQKDIEESQKKIEMLERQIYDLRNGADIDTYHFREYREKEDEEEELYDENDVDPPFLRYEP